LATNGDEYVQLVLDCWKRVFSLRTLGGGYRRYFLIFTDKSIIELETSHVSNVLPRIDRLYIGTFNDPFSYIFWGSIASIVQEVLKVREKQKQQDTLIASLSQRKLSDILNFIKNILKENLKIYKIEEKMKVDYQEIRDTKAKVSGINLELEIIKKDKKMKYYAPFASKERAMEALEKINMIFNSVKN